jgi:biotin transport system substrate-specific component|tara:strand:+ start:24 stop:575 length:552 start_codon:yes stop_codon:yes gene_type:complete
MELVNNIKQSQIIKSIFFALIGTILLSISAKIKIPFYPVPMTMQTFMVLFIGIVLGWKLGVATIALYLFEGVIGLPVFAGTPEKGLGLIYFTGPTMGYLVGFLFACFFAGYFKYSKNFLLNFLKLTFATSFIYILGFVWLGSLIGWDKPIFKSGVEPFLLAELFKVSLISLLASKIIKIRKIV